jgi:hypothetical protein
MSAAALGAGGFAPGFAAVFAPGVAARVALDRAAVGTFALADADRRASDFADIYSSSGVRNA